MALGGCAIDNPIDYTTGGTVRLDQMEWKIVESKHPPGLGRLSLAVLQMKQHGN